MRWIIVYFILIFSNTVSAKEWKSLRVYQKETQREKLLPSDWLKRDRIKNTLVWQEANVFNLKNNLSREYKNISQRRDFYKWFFYELNKKGHDVVWVQMAYFISKKMHLMEIFPYSIFSKKEVKTYARQGSELVFNNAFEELQKLYNSKLVLKTDKATVWDRAILKKEQYEWIDRIYKTMNAKSLKTLKRIAKGKCLYGLFLPRAIRFKGDLSKAETRYKYAIEVLKPYCKNRYK
ncbi:Insecticidal toxin complex protein [Flavivirga eckloniae]|uniref:Insecticidal toxin complex protein n=1 Tax=Flavivirga eckloniae TaxID=1803846 RepID=A0A2K9PM15_9FLAO|nr:Insecticidal toxin complex protein [Flavivirga eckloniae]AUP78076.1 Insecticidal toxin complex protein [Flavivirga eckloniae]